MRPTVDGGLGWQIIQPGDDHGLVAEQPLPAPGEQRRQIEVARDVRRAVGKDGVPEADDGEVRAHGEEPDAVGVEEAPDLVEGRLDGPSSGPLSATISRAEISDNSVSN